jgi:hypothetical protein
VKSLPLEGNINWQGSAGRIGLMILRGSSGSGSSIYDDSNSSITRTALRFAGVADLLDRLSVHA